MSVGERRFVRLTFSWSQIDRVGEIDGGWSGFALIAENAEALGRVCKWDDPASVGGRLECRHYELDLWRQCVSTTFEVVDA